MTAPPLVGCVVWRVHYYFEAIITTILEELIDYIVTSLIVFNSFMAAFILTRLKGWLIASFSGTNDVLD